MRTSMFARPGLKDHPCFSRDAHHKYGRIHLPVAPRCNIQCGYCVRKYDCANESRPGVSSRVLSPSEALERVAAVAGRDGRITVIGIAGPGDPLANPETFETFSLIRSEYPELGLCISTNGLMLPDNVDELAGLGVSTLTVTINALRPETAERIYSWVRHGGRTYRGRDAAELLLERQWWGLREAAAAGISVKVNTILIPGVNDGEVQMVATAAASLGAVVQNITALIPQGEFADTAPPTRERLAGLRLLCGEHIQQISHCRQCRADAAGLMGYDKDTDMETLLAKIGDEYLDMVAC
jgi:nitrogen fixation protein NifB